MYTTYPDYLSGTTQASSPMPVQTAVSHAPHDMLYLHHHSPGHEESIPPPQANPYFGHYSASGVSVGQDADGIPSSYHGYLSSGMHDSYGGLPDIGGNYTHRPLAPNTHTPMAPILQQPPPGQYRRDVMPISRLSPTSFSRPAPVVVKRHPSRKPRVRGSRGNLKREPSSSPPLSQAFGFDGSAAARGDNNNNPDAPAEEVTLDEKTPGELRRLWEIRKKWQKKKGHGMWEDIVREFVGPESDALTDDKKTQLKANLQMRVHRGVMKYGSWPESDKTALMRAYKRWEENRYIEIHRLFMEEVSLQGRQNPSFEWRTNHIEAELVKEGLEDKQRETPSKSRRRRVQVTPRHLLRGGASSGVSARPQAPAPQQQQQQQQRLPPVFDVGAGGGYGHFPGDHYGGHPYAHQQPQAGPHQQHQQQHRREMSTASSYSLMAEQLGAQPQALTDEQQERLIEECLERTPFEPTPEPTSNNNTHTHTHTNSSSGGPDEDTRMSDYPEEQLPRSRPQSSSLPAINGMMGAPNGASPDINAQRSAAVARQACGEMMKQQQHQSSSAHHQQFAV
ncbi:hypothetical protein VMCG_03415 [Cytospora schulzeri]|uniref:Uncharacterized protein n=1 Tax=Cytospora schulzeri TaxID=448051 RepID=A0A423WWE1_9PEZI|nr:hypothetical protein VMCG_03415 [Valsa malicola]